MPVSWLILTLRTCQGWTSPPCSLRNPGQRYPDPAVNQALGFPVVHQGNCPGLYAGRGFCLRAGTRPPRLELEEWRGRAVLGSPSTCPLLPVNPGLGWGTPRSGTSALVRAVVDTASSSFHGPPV